MATYDVQCLAELGGQLESPTGHLTYADHESDPEADNKITLGLS